MNSTAQNSSLRFAPRRPIGNFAYQSDHNELVAELQAAHAREGALLSKMRELSQHQVTVEQEFGHRLINGLQMIVSLLSLQSRNAASPEASAQLTIAANRIAAFGRVHRRLHLLDHKDQVEFQAISPGPMQGFVGAAVRGRSQHRHRCRGQYGTFAVYVRDPARSYYQ